MCISGAKSSRDSQRIMNCDTALRHPEKRSRFCKFPRFQEAHGEMLPLDIRKVKILQAIVNDYVQTSKPVGSERLIEVYQLGCKSATVRNEMAEMAEMGYLVQPHTSAGRIPTDRGYRYYVH